MSKPRWRFAVPFDKLRANKGGPFDRLRPNETEPFDKLRANGAGGPAGKSAWHHPPG